MKLSFDIIIPTYNGCGLLRKYLQPVIDAAASASYSGQITVVDDASTDDTVAVIAAQYPQVNCIRRSHNGGFIESCKSGIGGTRNPVFILLNNDIKVEQDFIDPLLKHFGNPKVFAVTAKSICPTPLTDRHDPGFLVNESVCRGKWERSMFDKYQPEIFDPESRYTHTCTNLFSSGGYSAFHRGKYEYVGGFDVQFKPYYWEDIDLCYRAWRQGWVSLYEPASKVYHLAHGTIRRDADQRARFLVETRNRFYFNWKYLDETIRIYQHIRYITRLLVKKKQLDHFELFLREALVKALPGLPRVLWKRFTNGIPGTMNMEDIIQSSGNKPWNSNL